MSSLLDLADPARRAEIFQKSISQLVAFCGNGRLTNGSATSIEFRHLLGHAPIEKFEAFVASCLGDPFKESGLALQDVVNEIGRRLGFAVDFGSYTGSQVDAAYDGLWTSPAGWQLVVEVKTTDGRIDARASSHLIVVGRDDTGELEAQVRGSRHAWDMRMVSTEALLWLLSIREGLDDQSAVQRITEVLKPEEYTKVDRIIKLVFDTTRETKRGDDAPDDGPAGPTGSAPKAYEASISLAAQNSAKDMALAIVGRRLGIVLTRMTRSLARGPAGEVVVVVYSKLHTGRSSPRYWAALHPGQMKAVTEAKGYGGVIVVCGEEGVLSLPREPILELLPKSWKTEREGGTFHHIVLVPKADQYVLLGSGFERDVTHLFWRFGTTD